MADAAVEHLEQHLTPEGLRPDGVGGSAHRARHGILTDRERRSRSVRIPRESPRSTTAAVAPAAVIRAAASRIGVSGVHTTGAPRISARTGWFAGSGLGAWGARAGGAFACISSSERATKRTLSGRASSALATGSGIR